MEALALSVKDLVNRPNIAQWAKPAEQHSGMFQNDMFMADTYGLPPDSPPVKVTCHFKLETLMISMPRPLREVYQPAEKPWNCSGRGVNSVSYLPL